jgi:hypothetical protein
MKTYNITIRATVTKTLQVQADSRDEAVETANDAFEVETDHTDENYEQDTIDITEEKA